MSESTEFHVAETPSIDDDPVETQDVETEGRRLSPREVAMAAIIEKAEATRRQEMADDADRLGVEAKPDPFADPVTPDVAATPAVEPEPVHAPVVEHAPSATRAIVLGGQQIAVSEEEFAQLAQLGALAAIQPPAQAVPRPVEVSRPIQDVPAPAIDRTRIAEAVQKIQFGTPEEGTEAFMGVINHVFSVAPPPPQIDVNSIVEAAANRARAEARMAQDSEVVKAEFPRVFADERLKALAHATVQQLKHQDVALGRFRPDIEIYREAGGQVYDLIREPRPGINAKQSTALQAAPSVSPRADIEERKRAAPRNPEAVSRRATLTETPRAPTGSEIVNQMRVRRGQPAHT
jgi:hypothetical protein